ncbi:Ecp28-3 [Fulvia fulva]|uniref:Ecp28-3 n=1 Tax=Passalora fulva TaxID=5499 RepID=A0A1P8YXM5_PASFU|nr:Ecp28-3 [Fulvia fulva]AQA29261.1 extracellular protein 28-3 [Fulvia fulva]KAK4632111.1 Ecp28-3 [Fulvia fulva]KAK4633503.1 Ecp28-3 [Fulvia fulva]UJO14632.1 Ecp28-3 [Fulvia fulva]WPV11746.1 Ecp28-3 [Fulvia fulva]
MRVLFTTLSALALFFAASVEACANYEDCKCHVPGTDLQNNEATQKACDQYARDHNAQAKFSADPHHQCTTSGLSNGVIDNCDFDTACKAQGDFEQYCWHKVGPFD